MKKAAPFIIVVVLLLVVVSDSYYTVLETQKALVLQLGKPVTQEAVGPGLHYKLPFMQNVIYFDSRILEYDADPAEILTSDKKTLVVDNYSKWRIVEPLTFYRTVRTIPGAQGRLAEVIYSQLREALGRHTLTEIVSSKRDAIMTQVTRNSSLLIKEYGIEVVDVRIKRTDLPAENERAIYGRMRAERERQAKQYRSEGQEESAKIRSKADRDRTVILAQARRTSEETKGAGDAQATKIYADALSQSPEFFEFKRSLDAYQRSLTSNTKILMTPENPFLKYLQQSE